MRVGGPRAGLREELLTSSMYSGSLAEASQRLLRMKMLGLERRSFTLWKKCFSCGVKREGGE